MRSIFDRVFKSLLTKEFRQIMRDKQILALLLITPTVQMIAYGAALDPEVKHVKLGVIDYSLSPMSRELTAAFVRNDVFTITPTGTSANELYKNVTDGKLDVGVVIPPEFERRIAEKTQSDVQVIINAVDANTAGIASSYISQIAFAFNRTIDNTFKPIGQYVSTQISFLYNPGLIASWFFAPAVIAISLNIAGTLVSSSTLLREKETGTIEQLLITPASSEQIILAKILPLIGVLFGVICVSSTLARLLFHVPFRGDVFFFGFVSLLYMFVLIALGLALATFAANQRQCILASFFILIPIIQLSGALTPIESMAPAAQYISLLDPLRYYVTCIRGILLKGNGWFELRHEVVALLVFATVLMTISVSRFRKQLI